MINKKLTGLALVRAIIFSSLKMGFGAFVCVETIIAFLRGVYILKNPTIINGFSNVPTGWLYIFFSILIVIISVAFLVVRRKEKSNKSPK